MPPKAKKPSKAQLKPQKKRKPKAKAAPKSQDQLLMAELCRRYPDETYQHVKITEDFASALSEKHGEVYVSAKDL